MSSVKDMRQYALMQLARGMGPGGNRLITNRSWEEMMTPIANLTGQGHLEQSVSVAWFGGHFDGFETLHHDGEDDGFLTQMVLVPACRAAVIWMVTP